ncbi:MAG: response regulator [Gaiellaceae bacterium]
MAPEPDRRAAAAAEERLDALIGTLPLVVYTAPLDADPHPRYISPKVEQLLGVPPAEFTLLELRERIHPDDRERAIEASDHADSLREPLTISYRVIRDDGTEVWVEDNSGIVEIDGEEVAHGYLLDVTERKRTEQALERDATVRRRVADIGRAALQGATHPEIVRMSLDVLRDGVSSDVGSFLQMVDGELVVTQAFGWEATGAVARAGSPAANAFESLCTYVGETDAANPESLLATHGLSGTIAVPVVAEDSLCFGVISIHVRHGEGFSDEDVSLVEQTAHLIAAAMARERLEDRLRLAQRLEVVGQLSAGVAHDFNNLLTAISGYNELALDHVDGVGCEYLKQVGHAADRARNLTSQLLAFSRRQVLRPTAIHVSDLVTSVLPMLRPLLGESIRIETSFEDAVVLTLFVPLTEPHSGAEAGSAAHEPPRTGSVLVVEDEEAVRVLLTQQLTSLGHRVAAVDDAPSALDALDGDRFDLVLSDVGLPGMGGADLVDAIAARHADVRVLLMSGYAGEALDSRRHVRLLHKPFGLDELSAEVARALAA